MLLSVDLPILSYSSVSNYCVCPRKFYYGSICRFTLPRKAAGAVLIGSAVHAGLARILSKPAAEDALDQGVLAAHTLLGKEGDPRYKETVEGYAITEAILTFWYKHSLPKLLPKLNNVLIPLLVETEHKAKIHGIDFHGYIDAFDPTTRKVIEHKTRSTSNGWNFVPDLWCDLQFLIYCLLAGTDIVIYNGMVKPRITRDCSTPQALVAKMENDEYDSALVFEVNVPVEKQQENLFRILDAVSEACEQINFPCYYGSACTNYNSDCMFSPLCKNMESGTEPIDIEREGGASQFLDNNTVFNTIYEIRESEA